MSDVILLDTSGSMAAPVGTRRRIDILGDILAAVLPTAPGTRLLSFNSITTELDNAVTEQGMNLPEPGGGTALDGALAYVSPLNPRRLIVISDGEPDDPRAAIAAGRALGCVIHTYYCGDDGNRAAIAFLRNLALCSKGGIGRAQVGDLTEPARITSEIRHLLTGPAR
jgi:hypothetical protein